MVKVQVQVATLGKKVTSMKYIAFRYLILSRARTIPSRSKSEKSALSSTTTTMSGSSVKSIQKRFYNALPRSPARPRSNSQSRSLYTPSLLPSFFDSPPPPTNSSRPTNAIPTKARILIEGRGQVENGQAYTSNSGTTAPLALATSYQSISPALASSYAFLPTPHSSTSASTAQTSSDGSAPGRKQKQRYQLDVGAYGIPKNTRLQRRSLHTAAAHDDAHLAVGVGEDAYFIRNNAMGVADGVGGWSKGKHAGMSFSLQPSTRCLVPQCDHPRLQHQVPCLPNTSCITVLQK